MISVTSIRNTLYTNPYATPDSKIFPSLSVLSFLTNIRNLGEEKSCRKDHEDESKKVDRKTQHQTLPNKIKDFLFRHIRDKDTSNPRMTRT